MDIKQVAIQAIQEAGETIRMMYSGEIHYQMKNIFDIQAEADRKSEAIIVGHIKKYFPQHSILSEEKGEEIDDHEWKWIIDPLDGTINYSRKIDEFCISIAVESHDELILGLIYEPLKNNLYLAEKGKGSFINNYPIYVSTESKAINCIIATDNSAHIETRIENYTILSRLCNEVRHIRVLGSGALHLAKLASGKIDAYYKTKANHWDYAAGILLVKRL